MRAETKIYLADSILSIFQLDVSSKERCAWKWIAHEILRSNNCHSPESHIFFGCTNTPKRHNMAANECEA